MCFIGRSILMLLVAGTLVGCNVKDTKQTVEDQESEVTAEGSEPGIEGYYLLNDPAFYGEQEMKQVPVGQIFHLGVLKGEWMMINMLTGYGGTYKEEGEEARLITTMGPTGEVEKEEGFALTQTETGVTLRHFGDVEGEQNLVFEKVSSTVPKQFDFKSFLTPPQ